MDLNDLDGSRIADVCVLLNPLLNTTKLPVLQYFMRRRGVHVIYNMLEHLGPRFEAWHVVRNLVKILQRMHDLKVLIIERIYYCATPTQCLERYVTIVDDLCSHEDSEVLIVTRNLYLNPPVCNVPIPWRFR